MVFKGFSQNSNVIYDTDNGNLSGRSNTRIGIQAGASMSVSNNPSDSFNTQNVFLGGFSGVNSNGLFFSENRFNTFLGFASGDYNSTGANNTFSGHYSGRYNKTGNNNVYFGESSGMGVYGVVYNAGSRNTGIGTSSLSNITSGSDNTILGSYAASNLTTGNYNIGIGSFAIAGSLATGDENIVIGHAAGYNFGTGGYNILIGTDAGRSKSISPISSNYNIGIGYRSLYNLTTGTDNFTLGFQSGYGLTSSSGNFFMGKNSGYTQTTITNSNNHFVGNYSGYSNTTGTENVFLGNNSGYNNADGKFNTYLGNSAGQNNVSGSNNLFLGYLSNVSGSNASTLNYATAIGSRAIAIRSNTTIIGDTTKNIQVGIGTAWPTQRLTIKGNFAFIAFNDGVFYQNRRFLFQDEYENIAMGTNHDEDIQGKGNLLLGIAANINQGINHSTAIGYGSNVSVDNGFVLGNNQVKVGIGTSTPNARLELSSGKEGESGLLFTNLRQGNCNKFLTVNELGQVVLEKPIIKVSSPDEWSDKVFEANYSLKNLFEIESFIKINKHLPNIPSAEEMSVNGIETEKMAVKLLEKIEELTLYLIEMKKENKSLKDRVEILEKK